MSIIPYGKQVIDESDINAVVESLKSDYLTTGPKVQEFEDKLSKYTNSKYVVVVSNATAGLHLASLCLLEKGDKVLTTPNSFLATSNSILYVGAIPIFVDIKDDGNIDLDLCEEYLKKDSSIKAIYVVHFSGKMLNQDKLKYLKEKYNIKILEDCAHSIGSEFIDSNNNIIKSASSTYSDCSILSFHPVKQLTTGEGGAITTNDKNLYEKLLKLRSHGMTRNSNDFVNLDLAFDSKNELNSWYYEMQDLGFNYRLTDIQSALGISQLNKLASFIEKRREIVRKYDLSFKNLKFIKPLYTYTKESSYHLYVLQIDFDKLNIIRNRFMKKMLENDIGSQVHYIPINKQPYYKSLGYGSENTPVMDNYYSKCLSIPLYPSLTDDEINKVISVVRNIKNEK